MLKNIFLQLISLILFNCLCFQYVLAETANNTSIPTSTETFLSTIPIDLPQAEVTCKAGGSLSGIFLKSITSKSGGNAFFVDKNTKEIALFERAVFNSSINISKENDKKNTAEMFIKVPNVTRENLVNLLLKRQLVVSRNAKIIFVVKMFTDKGLETFIFSGKDTNGNNVTSTLYTRVKKLSTINVNGDKFFTSDVQVKIYFPEPPKRIDTDGSLVNVFNNFPGSLVCKCKGCPIHDFDLSDLRDAFDQGLVDSITNEAVNTSQNQ